MHPVLRKSFGGLSFAYYFRQMFFSLIVGLLYVGLNDPKQASVGFWFMAGTNFFLYPYSRFVYERIVGFILGENIFFVNALLMLFFKLMTMVLCWGLAVVIAPLGLIYLYVHHSRAEQS